jgi:secreted trypsin-like serine protease
MTRSFASFILTLIAVIIGTAPARAVTGTYQPDPIHTYVGLAVFYDQSGNFAFRCSGSLIAPQVFLTAGHCADDAENSSYARIYFQQEAGANFDPATQHDPVTGYPDTCISGDPLCVTGHRIYDYGFNNFVGFPDTHDAGIVLLDVAITFQTKFASLATANSLTQLANRRGVQDVSFIVSGYGVSDNWPPVQGVLSFRVRLMAVTKLNNLRNSWTAGFNLQTSNSPGNNRGGTCSGDSGGPVLWDASDIIVAVTSFGKHEQCLGNDYSYRTDQQAVIDWILGIADIVGERNDISIVPLR